MSLALSAINKQNKSKWRSVSVFRGREGDIGTCDPGKVLKMEAIGNWTRTGRITILTGSYFLIVHMPTHTHQTAYMMFT